MPESADVRLDSLNRRIEQQRAAAQEAGTAGPPAGPPPPPAPPFRVKRYSDAEADAMLARAAERDAATARAAAERAAAERAEKAERPLTLTLTVTLPRYSRGCAAHTLLGAAIGSVRVRVGVRGLALALTLILTLTLRGSPNPNPNPSQAVGAAMGAPASAISAD